MLLKVFVYGTLFGFVAPAIAQDTPDEALADVAALADRPTVRQAFSSIEGMRERNNERLVRLNEIAAPPFDETDRGEAFAKELSELGADEVVTDSVGNVIGMRRGTVGQRNIAVVAHLDTVFPGWTDVTVKREGNVFTAPGIGDNTRGLVATLALLEALEAHDLETEQNLLFIGSVGEEGLGDLRGVRHLFSKEGTQIDAMLAVDGGSMDRLVISGVGSNRYRVTFSGPGGHSYGNFGDGHPHQALGTAIDEFATLAMPITKSPGAKATFSVGRIGGGTSINSIPFSSWMEVDMRSVDPIKLEQLDAAFKQAVQRAVAVENARRRSGPAIEVKLEQVGQRPAGQGDQASPLVQHALQALRTVGATPTTAASSTDANIPISMGVPAVTMSRGGISRNAHAPDESWEDVDSHKAIQALLLTVLAEAKLASGDQPTD